MKKDLSLTFLKKLRQVNLKNSNRLNFKNLEKMGKSFILTFKVIDNARLIFDLEKIIWLTLKDYFKRKDIEFFFKRTNNLILEIIWKGYS